MYKKACPICGDVKHDDDMDRLIETMKKHMKKHEDDDKDETGMKAPAADTVVLEPVRMKEDEMRMKEDETAIISSSGFMSPAATLDEAVVAFEMFDSAKERLLRDRDVLWFGKGGAPVKKGTPDAKPYLLKSAWRRMARFFGLSIDLEGREKLETGDGYIWTYRYRITHPCGAYVVSEGVCSSNDSFFTKGGRNKADEADVMLKAQTVSLNRGIADLLGSGEVSAEEMRKE